MEDHDRGNVASSRIQLSVAGRTYKLMTGTGQPPLVSAMRRKICESTENHSNIRVIRVYAIYKLARTLSNYFVSLTTQVMSVFDPSPLFGLSVLYRRTSICATTRTAHQAGCLCIPYQYEGLTPKLSALDGRLAYQVIPADKL